MKIMKEEKLEKQKNKNLDGMLIMHIIMVDLLKKNNNIMIIMKLIQKNMEKQKQKKKNTMLMKLCKVMNINQIDMISKNFTQ